MVGTWNEINLRFQKDTVFTQNFCGALESVPNVDNYSSGIAPITPTRITPSKFWITPNIYSLTPLHEAQARSGETNQEYLRVLTEVAGPFDILIALHASRKCGGDAYGTSEDSKRLRHFQSFSMNEFCRYENDKVSPMMPVSIAMIFKCLTDR